MAMRKEKLIARRELPKSPTGIVGLDQITGGGLPHGRPTLVCGGTGCGKTMLAMEFLVRGATEFNEPGVFMSFEETDKELVANVASMGFDRPNSLPVVMLTSSRQGPDLAECYRLGANGYVVKPMESAAFFEAIKTTGTFWAMVNERPPVSKVSEVGDADPARK